MSSHFSVPTNISPKIQPTLYNKLVLYSLSLLFHPLHNTFQFHILPTFYPSLFSKVTPCYMLENIPTKNTTTCDTSKDSIFSLNQNHSKQPILILSHIYNTTTLDTTYPYCFYIGDSIPYVCYQTQYYLVSHYVNPLVIVFFFIFYQLFCNWMGYNTLILHLYCT